MALGIKRSKDDVVSVRGLRAGRREAAAPRKQTGPTVLLLHGANVPRVVMLPLKWRLQKYGRRCENLAFNTQRFDIHECAESVARQARALGLKEFDAVTHSAGGVILRWAMNHCDMPRLRRAVMIAPPSNGAWVACRLHRQFGPLYRLLFGETGLQLRRAEHGITSRAGHIDGAEVGVIAGGSGTPAGKRNLWRYPGDTDGTIAVDETILRGMKDFLLLNCDHTTILYSSQTAMMANLFLEHGEFRPRRPDEGDEHA